LLLFRSLTISHLGMLFHFFVFFFKSHREAISFFFCDIAIQRCRASNCLIFYVYRIEGWLQSLCEKLTTEPSPLLCLYYVAAGEDRSLTKQSVYPGARSVERDRIYKSGKAD